MEENLKELLSQDGQDASKHFHLASALHAAACMIGAAVAAENSSFEEAQLLDVSGLDASDTAESLERIGDISAAALIKEGFRSAEASEMVSVWILSLQVASWSS